MGALYATQNEVWMLPEEGVHKALAAAAEHADGVGGPFDVIALGAP